MANTNMQQAIAKTIVKSYLGDFSESVKKRIESIKFDYTDFSSNFDYKTNTIFITRKSMCDVNHYVHELFHAISTINIDNKILIGFNKKEFTKLESGKILETSIGYALNEGATHSYTLSSTNNRYGKIKTIPAYDFCANIYKNLENIIGTDLMKLSYLNNGLNEFINVISKNCHTKPENVIKLIINMDCYLDTERVYSMFLKHEYSHDALTLLKNCYGYLSRIISDYNDFNNKNVNMNKILSSVYLNEKEKITFNDITKSLNLNYTLNENVDLKSYEKMAQYIFLNIDEKKCGMELLPSSLKSGEFFNFLLINNYIVDKDRNRESFETFDAKSKLTKIIFEKDTGCFDEDNNLSENIKTLLSTRYVVRADTQVSDYYMIKSLKNDEFCEYIKKSDPSYYKSLLKQQNNSLFTK